MSEQTGERGPNQERRERVRLYRTDAIVLRRRDLGEADRILTLFTPTRGKLRVVAKGVRRTKSRLAGHLEPFARTSLLIAQGRNLDIVTQAQLLEPFAQLRSDEARIAYTGYFADLLDLLTAEGEANEAAYDTLVAALRAVDSGLDLFVTARFYEMRLLGVIGFRPELYQCTTCGRELEPVRNAFGPGGGGVLCPECARAEPDSLPLSVNALKYLRLLQQEQVRLIYGLRLSEELRAEVEDAMRASLRQILQRDPPSRQVLHLLSIDSTLEAV